MTNRCGRHHRPASVVRCLALDTSAPIPPQELTNRTAGPILTSDDRSEAARIGPKSPSHQEMGWQTRTSAWNLRGCHGDFERKWNLGRPKTGSALHHLVTAFSVKKGLMILRGIEAVTLWQG